MQLKNLTESQMRILMDYSWVKRHLEFKLVHYGRNYESLAGIIYVSIFDLAIVPLLDLEEVMGIPVASSLPDTCVEAWEISKERLIMDSMKNSERLYPAKLESIEEVLFKLTQGFYKEEEIGNMYVLSNFPRANGARCMLYNGALKNCSLRLEGGFYVLPSSVHETILVPEHMIDGPEELIQMVRDINRTQVRSGEVLSNEIYKYEPSKNILCQLDLGGDDFGGDKAVALNYICLDAIEKHVLDMLDKAKAYTRAGA